MNNHNKQIASDLQFRLHSELYKRLNGTVATDDIIMMAHNVIYALGQRDLENRLYAIADAINSLRPVSEDDKVYEEYLDNKYNVSTGYPSLAKETKSTTLPWTTLAKSGLSARQYELVKALKECNQSAEDLKKQNKTTVAGLHYSATLEADINYAEYLTHELKMEGITPASHPNVFK